MKQIGILAMCAIMTGCATTIGSSEFSCKGYSEAGYSCKSAREVFELTNNSNGPVTDLDYREETARSTSPQPRSNDQVAPGHPKNEQPMYQSANARSKERLAQTVTIRPNNVRIQTPNVLTGPTPIRTQAKVMRVWVNSYEDKAGALHSPQLVYNEIVERKWQFGNQAIDRSSETPVVRSSRTARPAESQPTPVGE